MVDLVCLAFLLFGCIGGWRKGFVLGAISLVGVACAYLACYFGYRSIGSIIGGVFGLEPLISYPLAGALCFGVVSVMFGIIGFRQRRRQKRAEKNGRSSRLLDRIAGAFLGALQMAAWIVLVVGVLSLAQGVAPKRLPDFAKSRTGRIANPVLAKLTSLVVARTVENPNVQHFVESAMKHPERVAKNTKLIASNPNLWQLFSDPLWVDSLAKPQTGARNTPHALAVLSRDKEFVAAAAELGLLPSEKGSLSPQAVETAMVKKLAPVARSLYAVRNDPQIQKLMKDPEIAHLVSERKVFQLLNHPKFNQVLRICGEHFEKPDRGQKAPEK